MQHSVLITTSGLGSRLGELTRDRNKALLSIGKRPVLSHIIDAYPENTRFIITLGYLGEDVRDYLALAYPHRSFEFVTVRPYEGPGSSLGFSIFQAKHLLQCPFIFHASDTLVLEKIPTPDINWIGGCSNLDGLQAEHYRTLQVRDGYVTALLEKGEQNFSAAHIGLIGVHDFEIFWANLDQLLTNDVHGQQLSDVHVLQSMIDSGCTFSHREFRSWQDAGTPLTLEKARTTLGEHFVNLDKPRESVYILHDRVIKFYADPLMVTARVERAKHLGGVVPQIVGVKKHFFAYTKAEGELYANSATPEDFLHFLTWAKQNVWTPYAEVSEKDFRDACRIFYKTKTLERIAQFHTQNSIIDAQTTINGIDIPSLGTLIEQIDFDHLSNGFQCIFHGDFILDNIIRGKNNYVLIDWRHNFGKLSIAGDMYYDLAKLMHNLTVNHEIIHRNLFTIDVTGDTIHCDILRRNELVQCENVLTDFLKSEGFDHKKVQILTALVWLNMSPLHHRPFNLFLYYFGKLSLWRALQQKP